MGYEDVRFDQDLAYPFPSILKRAIEHKNKKKFVVWGTGKQMRDFIHIEDVIHNSLIISKKVKDGKAINLSTGKFTSFLDLAKLTLKILKKTDIKVVGNSSKPEGVFARGGSTLLQKKYGAKNLISLTKAIEASLNKLLEIH